MEQENLQKIEEIVRGLFTALGTAPAGLTVEWQATQERIYVSIDAGDNNGFLIGKEGRILEALKEIIEAASSRALGTRVDIYLDIGKYWSKIEAKALESAKNAAEEAARTGRPVKLEPMHPMLRRFLHKALQNDPEVETVSEGEGTWKKMVIQKKSGDRSNI
ncbi:MAG: KH domain-containing protein [Elusimicrobia bacterium]|nr:KH domain-containing protein [Elusimicrobiota bacterium]